MNPSNSSGFPSFDSPYRLFFTAASSLPISHYLTGILLVLSVFLYNFLELHFFRDVFTGFRGQEVTLTFNSSSQLYHDVVSKCKILHGRYLSTPWLCSPHLQTMFLHFSGNAPVVNYRRQIFRTPDGGTLALDWVVNVEVNISDIDFNPSYIQVNRPAFQVNDAMQHNDRNPIMIIIPGLTSASDSAYIKHLAFKMAKRGWNVVVSNHRGLGGVPITSDQFYNGGWTEDVRCVINHIHTQFPEAPLFLAGASLGANMMVKYLGEDGINVPIVGAAAVCSPWDLLICDRFIGRRLVQRLYNKALTAGLKQYAYKHGATLSRLSNWEAVKKARTVRDFDDNATRVLGKYETVDTFYRCCSSSNFIGKVAIPLLCISSLDDPVCPSEGIPWDECRLNKNVILATTQHGGHLPFFEGLTANSVWWVRALEEFFTALQSSLLAVPKKEMTVSDVNPPQFPIDHAPYVHVSEDGMVAAISTEVAEQVIAQHEDYMNLNKTEDSTCRREKPSAEIEPTQAPDTVHTPETDKSEIVVPVKRHLDQLSRQNLKSLWLLAYIAIFTTWPIVSPSFTFFWRKFQNILSKKVR